MTAPASPTITPPRILLLPGWQNSGAAHWQSRWELLHGDRRVDQDDWMWPKRGDWMARLEEILLLDDIPAVLVAHSLGCQLVAAWAAHSRNVARVQAALLVAPPDVEREEAPPQLAGWRPILRQRLPFRSITVISTDDDYCRPERAAEMASAWGSEMLSLGACGHINGESGLADWPAGRNLLQSLIATPA